MPSIRFFSTLTLGLLAVTPLSINAQSVSTTPVGAMTVTIAPGAGTSRALSVVSFPLLNTAGVTGAMTGRITGLTASTISNTAAGWGAGELSDASAPCLVQITSGAAVGRTFLVSRSVANTSTMITIDSEDSTLVDLTTLGITTGASGDTYKILACDTLLNLFPGNTVQGGTSSASADIVQVLVGGSYSQYYFNTTSQAWLKIALGSPNSNNLPIRPDALVLFNRIAATPLEVSLVGEVPSISRGLTVKNSGVTSASTYWPVDMTLAGLNIHQTPGWVASSSSSTADIVSVFTNGSWSQYFYNGTDWRKIALGSPVSNTLPIPSGAGIVISKRGAGTGATSLAQALPYTL